MTLPVEYITELNSDDDRIELFSRLKSALIMMVDDEPIVMDVLETFLDEEGYNNCIKIDQSPLAIEAIKREKPDILLLDLKMPDVDGFDILNMIRLDDEIKLLPVIVLTSSSDPANKLKALELGATEFLPKPIDASELALRLRNSLMVKAYQDQLAYYDTLTKLPNRKLFIERVEQRVNLPQQQPFVVMTIAVDRFKQINDSLGLKAGDALLQKIAYRLVKILRNLSKNKAHNEEDFIKSVARSGGDEFSILLVEEAQVDSIDYVVEEVLSSLRQPFEVEEGEVFITASVGVALYPEDGAETNTLLRQSAAASAHAKKSGRDSFSFYTSEISTLSREKHGLETALRRAMEREELLLFYQPKVDISTGRVVGSEALLRWYREDESYVPPDKFIPIAEETGLIIPIGEWVLHEACRQNSLWHSQGFDSLKVSVNVSGHQFRKRGFSAVIKEALTNTRMLPDRLILELTESMLIGNIDRNVQILEDIKEFGAGLSIDDFGTGYSSLSYLSRFPIDELKIDRSFIMDVPESPNDSAIVRAIVAMADSLELSVVAEGIENEKQLNFLQAMNCNIIQGYYYSRPLPADEFLEFVKVRNIDRESTPPILTVHA